MTDRLVNWETLELTVDGAKLERIAQARIKASGVPIEKLRLTFTDSLLRVNGSYRKMIAIPFEVRIERIETSGKELVVPIGSISAGGLPVPRLLSSLIEAAVADGAIRYDGKRVVIRLDRFLPDFVDVEIAEARIIKSGLFIRTASGGADPPEPGGINV